MSVPRQRYREYPGSGPIFLPVLENLLLQGHAKLSSVWMKRKEGLRVTSERQDGMKQAPRLVFSLHLMGLLTRGFRWENESLPENNLKVSP